MIYSLNIIYRYLCYRETNFDMTNLYEYHIVGEDFATFLYLNRLTFGEYAHFQLTRKKK